LGIHVPRVACVRYCLDMCDILFNIGLRTSSCRRLGWRVKDLVRRMRHAVSLLMRLVGACVGGVWLWCASTSWGLGGKAHDLSATCAMFFHCLCVWRWVCVCWGRWVLASQRRGVYCLFRDTLWRYIYSPIPSGSHLHERHRAAGQGKGHWTTSAFVASYTRTAPHGIYGSTDL